ncbi:hypothetical protein ACFQI7_25480 [Paenibacillus allorhizosphaerae]|uniref:Uncharacterized protein n=1 Tax=Paenibacillus allorhizosphaerae TaxID=2849866 RepID=A0ABN7TLA7_9BACL|nr:hypothetical protein [Paenibacillus allorhizosphaerae]CAG7645265.1 hypothetical protein PAECIP111802_03473 [Paenibacillus allorhizosphaerae]
MTTVMKPVIPHIIAESIESLRTKGWSDEDFFNFPRYDEDCPDARLLFHFFRNHRVTFAAAIINGYEVMRGA